ncbi:hypothetical protein QFC21_005828 [Naganishia friedmannii]|uniref:Uncharacterized protein n=1 Tax=Naganishia friedmannii TaxID=89922 RepID=A0ACC2V6R0_9TREE|nr:hypothetical protein QFC21_005828 [Naganishia friedmannii]
MSSLPVAPPRKVQARNIDEKKAPPHDLLLTYASSLTNSRLLPLPEWLRAGCPTGRYTGPRPTYQLKFNWSNLEVEGPVAVSKKFFCLLGMASSTASVERLFSHAGHVLGRKRGSLSAKLLSKQVMLRMWDLMGLLTGDELVAAETEEEDEAEE